MTMNIAGKMQVTVGKSIFTGAFIAFSSAASCRLLRESAAWTRRIRPSEIPSWSAWISARTNEASSGEETERVRELRAHRLAALPRARADEEVRDEEAERGEPGGEDEAAPEGAEA